MIIVFDVRSEEHTSELQSRYRISYAPMVYPTRASDPIGTSSFEVYLAYFLGILLSSVELRRSEERRVGKECLE